MTVLKITVEDEQAGRLRELLQTVPFVKNIEEEYLSKTDQIGQHTSYERIKTLLEEAKDKNLFSDIDPSAWQREIRKEWDRDF